MDNRKEDSTTSAVTTENPAEQFRCTSCGGDATVAWANDKKKDINVFGAILKPGERLCLACGKRRGVGFF
jgi:hypothetical protein